MEMGIVIGCIAAIVTGAVLLVLDRRQRRKETIRIRKMRGGTMYQSLGQDVRRIRGYALDQILVERDQVIFRGVRPPEVICRFSMADHNLRFLNENKLRTLTMLLSEDIPELADHDKYHLHSYRTRRPNGQKDRGWEYVITNRYKTRLLREWQWRMAGIQNGNER